jgi:crossover junction endodeoxyribonuclease RuvC
MTTNTTRIIGIDPGSQNLGYGVIEVQNQTIVHLHHGVFKNAKLGPNERLAYLRTELDLILQEFKPQVAAVEKVFLGKNPQSVFRLGLARGVAIAGLALNGVQIFEYAPTKMKKMITGSGHAEKATVARSVKNLLKINHDLEFDAADALGLAYLHARVYSTQNKLLIHARI